MPPKGSRQRSRTPHGAAAEAEVSAPLKELNSLVLSLESRPDRRKRCGEMLRQEVPWLQCEFFNATDGRADDIPESEVARTWNTKSNALYGRYEDVCKQDGSLLHSAAEFADPGVEYWFSAGERGCAHSHLRMWQRVAAAEAPLLLLEDDVRLLGGSSGGGSGGRTFTARLELAMQEATRRGADVLYLGWAGFYDGHPKFHKGRRGRKNAVVRKAEYVWTTVAYVLWPSGAKKLLERARPMNQPVDNFMAWECREGRLEAYVTLAEGDAGVEWSGGIVDQVDFIGDSDIKKSDGGDQGHDPTAFLISRERAESFVDAVASNADQPTGEPIGELAAA